jgi:hypothetical protein
MNKEKKGWSWREKELSMKEFYALPHTTRIQYIDMIEKLPQIERSSGDIIILNQYSRNIDKIKNFITLELE